MKITVVILSALFTLPAFASTFVGNGGDVVWKEGRLTMLDFVEGAVNSSKLKCSSHAPELRKKLPDDLNEMLSERDIGCLSDAFARVGAQSKLTAELLLKVPQMYRWVPVDEELKKSGVDSPYIEPGSALTVANRHIDTVLINRSGWEQMNSADRAGLVLHELVYAAEVPEPKGKGFFQQTPLAVRHLVGLSFVSGKKGPSEYDWLRFLAGDQLWRGMLANSSLEPAFYEFTPPDGETYKGIFFQRRCAGEPCAVRPLEFVVRNLYTLLMKRAGTSAEVYNWVEGSKQDEPRSCPSMLTYFLSEKWFLEQSISDQNRIAGNAFLRVMGT
ncbi:MAG: hypothetical protein ACXVBE_18185, partial [Bdellovibrionota bacterium]